MVDDIVIPKKSEGLTVINKINAIMLMFLLES